MAELNRKLNGQIKFIGINAGINDKMEKIREFVRKNHIDFAVVFDADQRIMKSFGVMGIPTHILIDKKGKITFRGAEAPADVEARLKELLR